MPPLPSYCHKVDVPGECCPSLTCSVPNKGLYTPTPGLVPMPVPTPGPNGQIPTPKPTNAQIIVMPPGSTFNGGSSHPGNGSPVPPGQSVTGLRGIIHTHTHLHTCMHAHTHVHPHMHTHYTHPHKHTHRNTHTPTYSCIHE